MGVDYAEQFKTARGRIFNLLSDLQWHSWRELRKIGGVGGPVPLAPNPRARQALSRALDSFRANRGKL